MPRDSQGSYTLPSGSLVSVGETIVPSQHNPPFLDIEQAISDSLNRDGKGGMRAPLNMGGNRVNNLSPGVQATDAATVGQITGLSGVPIGFIGDWPSATPPTGWLICAGQTLSRTDYAALFAVVGTAFGAPSASTFQLPDYRGRVAAGLDVDSGGFANRLSVPDSKVMGASGGASTVTLTTDQMPAHTHAVSGSTNAAGDHTHALPIEGGGIGTDRVTAVPSGPGGSVNTGISGSHSHTLSGTADSAGLGQAHANVQPTIIMNKIIKATSS